MEFDPKRPDFSPYGFTCVRWSPSPMPRPDHHNEIELNMVGSGWVNYLLGGCKIRIAAGHMSVFWAAIPHQIIDYARNTNYFVATIPLSWFLQCKLPERLTIPLMQGKVISERNSDRKASDLAMFEQWRHDLETGGEELKETVLLEIEARMRRLASNLPTPSSDTSGHHRFTLQEGGLKKVEQMACIVAQRYTEQLSVDEVSNEVGLHPNYAMNLFKKTFGTTLVEYLTQHRVSHAQRLLVTTDQKIVEIALNSGFNSVSRFNEAFRRACRCTPREYRHAHPL